ncbi:MAG TPA: hypothetical protein VM686_36690 [Polyangiaceae bacterium]|nr:hypothetical protein [Polyangiaceae bacterium]
MHDAAMAPSFFVRRFCSLVLILMFGCERNVGSGESAPAATNEPAPRYWLWNVVLLQTPNGPPGFSVTSPRLIELLENGRVRSLEGKPSLEGFLPRKLLEEPGEGAGLMLYVQQAGELALDKPTGAILGKLHPGAFVSVVPGRAERVRVGNLPFKNASRPIVAYARSDSLGTTQRQPMAYKPARFRSVLFQGSFSGWLSGSRDTAEWSTLPCRDVWISQNESVLSQYAAGVEMIGANLDRISPHAFASSVEARQCPAHAAFRRGADLMWNGQDWPDTPIRVDRAPAGYEPLAPPADDVVRGLMTPGRSFYWLIDSEKGVRCDEWKLTRFAQRAGRLTRTERVEDADSRSVASYPLEYTPAAEGKPAALHFKTLELDGKVALKCDCELHYQIVRADSKELLVLGRELPEQAVAYDPTQAERWFLSRDACQAASQEVSAKLASDGTLATHLGLHAINVPWGI